MELADYNKAIEIDPNNAVFYNNRGIFFLKNDEPTKALADLNKAIVLDPKMALAYRNRAFLYNQIGEKEKARADEKAADAIEGTPVK